MHNILIIWPVLVLLALATGCQDTSQLESEIAELKKSVDSRFDAAKQEMAKMDVAPLVASIKDTKQEWSDFQRSYSAEIREELNRNLQESKRSVAEINEIRGAVDGILIELKKMQSESKEFRDQTQQHAVKSKEFNKIGELESSLQSIKSKLTRIENDVRRAKLDAANAKQRARQAESRARSAERKAR